MNEVESLYYAVVVIDAIAERQGKILGRTADELRSSAIAAAFRALAVPGTPARLAAIASGSALRRAVVEHLPGQADLMLGGAEIKVKVPSPYHAVLLELQAKQAMEDLDGVARLVPIRSTGICDGIAKALRYQGSDDYVAAVRTAIRDDAVLADQVAALVGELPPAQVPSHEK